MILTHQFSAARPLGLLFAVASLLSLVLPHPGQLSAGTITFSLGSPTFSGSIAEFDLQLEFTGDPGDRINAIQFGVNELDPGLPTDFSRFSFALDNNSPFDSWLSSGTLGSSGAELLAPFLPAVGPFVTPGTR